MRAFFLTIAVCVRRMRRSAPLQRRDALLIRGPSDRIAEGLWVPALPSSAKQAPHRVRET